MKGERASVCGSTCCCQMNINLLPTERVDDLQFRNLHIIQDQNAFRFGMDSVLLADFALPKPGERVFDLGTGSGIIPLLLYMREPKAHYQGIEIDEAALSRACRSMDLNDISAEKIHLFYGDIRKINQYSPANCADLVVCNPPYHVAPGGTVHHGQARMEESCTLQDVCYAARYLLINRGRFCMVYPAVRLQEVCITLAKNGLSLKRLRFIQHTADRKPKLMLLEAYMGSKQGETQVLPPLIIQENGQDSAEIRRIYHMDSASDERL